MMSWFSNVLLMDGEVSPETLREAMLARRNVVVFESLGTPDGWDVRYGELEMGGDGPTGEVLTVACPTLSPTSPQSGAAPDVRVAIFKDGALWQEGCGTWELTVPGVYRATAWITPNHLADLLGDMESVLLREYPWMYTNSFRVGM
jgi:hypothetical protein